MFGRKQEAQETTPTKGPSAPPVTLLTVVGDTAKMEGKFQIADSIQIECEVGGELRVGGKLVIGEKGVVNATVETVDAIILGHYDGNMTATGNVEIAATGRVRGNIKTDSLVISKGGYFRGNVVKINEEPGQAVHEPDGQRIAGEHHDRDDGRRLLGRQNAFIAESHNDVHIETDQLLSERALSVVPTLGEPSVDFDVLTINVVDTADAGSD
jgi:cytoskeletal protein CcmA (bactofilin family)